MLLQAKTKRTQKKLNKTTINSINSMASIVSNPEIQILIQKLQLMTDQIQQQKLNPLNLVQWERSKYKPTQSQNRIKIQNKILMKIAEDETYRPRIKPIKRFSTSEEKKKSDFPLNYKEHYKQIITQINRKNTQEESDEQLENKDNQITSAGGFKYYNSLKKYVHLVSYIQDKISQKETQKLQKINLAKNMAFNSTSNTAWNERSLNRMRITSKTVPIGNRQCEIKIDSIIKKWRPSNSFQKRKISSEKSYSSKKQPKTTQFMQTASKISSLRYSTERKQTTNLQGGDISQILIEK